MNLTLKLILRWAGMTLGGLLIILVLALSLMDWNLLKHPLERMASAKSGRTVHIAGDLQVRI
jgi:uncharacterized protein involved in outer membrane biogenesis